MKKAVAYANANIALVKYWGKTDHEFNIPAVSSLSMTLDGFGTTVTVSSQDKEHALQIESTIAPSATTRLTSYLELIRRLFPYHGFLHITSESNVPYESGLASSSAFFAAVAVAINQYLDLRLDSFELSKLARIGSGSAARSIFPGLVGLYGGLSKTHHDAHAFPVTRHPSLDLAIVLAVVNNSKKSIPSRDAMNLTKDSSPFFHAFIISHEDDFNGAQAALNDNNFEALGSIMEHSTLKMFATMWTAKPAVFYWHPNTLALIDLVYQLRRAHGPIAYFTMDAGPNVKILCRAINQSLIMNTVEQSGLTIGVKSFLPGQGAHLIESNT
jgi:diphosphomevalonate decarboxylase